MKKSLLLIAGILLFSSTEKVSAMGNDNPRIVYLQKNSILVLKMSNREGYIIQSADSNTKIISLQVFSILGSQVNISYPNSSSTEFYTDKFRPGRYMIQAILSNGKKEVFQIIRS